MLSEVAITRLASEPSEPGDRMDPTTFFDDSSYCSKSSTSDEKKKEISKVQESGPKRPFEEVFISSPPTSVSAFYEPTCVTPVTSLLKLEPRVEVPRKAIDLSNQLPTENSITRTALTRASASKISPMFNEFCRVASWAEQYESMIRDYRLEAATLATPDTFEFIFAIPLRRIDGRLNNQWHDCYLNLSLTKKVHQMRNLFIDPFNHDVLFVVTLKRTESLGQQFHLSPADGSDIDGPYVMPKAVGSVLSLRDGHLSQNDSALECGIEVDVTGVCDKDSKMLAYWHEVSNQWLHVPLRSLNKVLIHQKRCVLNVFDIHRGRITDDRLIMEAGIYSCSE